MAEGTAEFHNSLIGRYPLFWVARLEERPHIINVGNHLIDVEGGRKKGVAKGRDDQQIGSFGFQGLILPTKQQVEDNCAVNGDADE